MQIQIAVANAKAAEQNALTAAKEGEAKSATAKWEQEVIKAKAVVQADQEKEVAETQGAMRLAVAELDRKAAEATKMQNIALGEGEAARRKLVMEADGALAVKLDAWVKVNGQYADAIAKYQGNWVPTVQTGSSGQGGNGANDLIGLLTAKTAKDLALDPTIVGKQAPAAPAQ